MNEISMDGLVIDRYRLSAEELLEADNQLIPELVGTGDACNPFKATTSSPRNHMTDKFFTQKLVVEGAEPRRFYTGVEAQIGKYNVGTTMPSTGTVLRVIPLYRSTMGKDNIPENPETLVIYEEFEDENGKPGTIRSVLVKGYHTDHKTFGFKLKQNTIQRKMLKGYPLTDIPTISDEGQYCYGLEAKTAFMSVPGVTEDGIIISESFSKRMTTTIIGTAVISYGDKYFPLNIHGDENTYKPFPDIGEKIHPSGLLLALRAYNPLYDHVTMSKNSVGLDDVDYDNDRPYFGLPGAEIIDVRVVKRPEEDFSKLPEGMAEQTDKYFNQHMEFYKEVLEFYNDLSQKKRRLGEELSLGHEFRSVIRTAIEYVGNNKSRKFNGQPVSKKNIKYTYNRIPLDSVRVEIKYALKVPPTEAYKATNCHGGKAVCVAVWPDDRMPTDADGHVADVIMDDISIIKRINLGVFYEQFMSAVLMKTEIEIKEIMEKGDINKAWERIDRLYEIISPLMSRRVRETITTMARKREHIQSVIDDGFYIYLPTHSPNLGNKMLSQLRKEFNFTYGPVTYIGSSGKRVTTKTPVLIGRNYMMLLNKIGDGWSAVTGAKLQHHGLPAKLNPSDRNLAPGRKNPVKFPAEAEIRSMVGAAGTRVAADLCDRSNNPEVNQEICRNILTNENPSDIDDAPNRKKNLFGGNRALRQATHIFDCMGVNLTFGNKDGCKHNKG